MVLKKDSRITIVVPERPEWQKVRGKRWGNRRHEMATLKVKERRKNRREAHRGMTERIADAMKDLS